MVLITFNYAIFNMLVDEESMYNHTEQRWLESTCSAVREGKVMFSKNVKPGMFGLGLVPKNFLPYSTQFVFLMIRLVPGNVVMVTTDMCGKSPITGSGYMELRENMCMYFNICSFYCR